MQTLEKHDNGAGMDNLGGCAKIQKNAEPFSRNDFYSRGVHFNLQFGEQNTKNDNYDQFLSVSTIQLKIIKSHKAFKQAI